jgi:hypothetical protein
MVEIVAMPQGDFRKASQSLLRTRRALYPIDGLLSAARHTLWLTGHARHRSSAPPCNFVDLRVELR